MKMTGTLLPVTAASGMVPSIWCGTDQQPSPPEAGPGKTNIQTVVIGRHNRSGPQQQHDTVPVKITAGLVVAAPASTVLNSANQAHHQRGCRPPSDSLPATWRCAVPANAAGGAKRSVFRARMADLLTSRLPVQD